MLESNHPDPDIRERANILLAEVSERGRRQSLKHVLRLLLVLGLVGAATYGYRAITKPNVVVGHWSSNLLATVGHDEVDLVIFSNGTASLSAVPCDWESLDGVAVLTCQYGAPGSARYTFEVSQDDPGRAILKGWVSQIYYRVK